MKKSTKSEKPAAPQVKPVTKKTVETTPAKKTAAPKKIPTPSRGAPAAAATSKARAAAAPASTPKPAGPSVTSIVAKVDVGFGNQLHIRGDAPGLSWDEGVLMSCVADDQWTYTIAGATKPVLFKLLLNDVTWSVGEDYAVAAGGSVVVTPTF
ncbi:MAG TPA: hypothetical protein VHF69_06060 [Candidatus Synoicihabitans sp.]|nr:hypothetical protein [Candidatus Synoicihabitans sp.]